MCGIFGIIDYKITKSSISRLKELSGKLFILSESRRKEAAGLALICNNKIYVYKEPVSGSKFIKLEDY